MNKNLRILAVLLLAFTAFISVQAQETATPRAGDGIGTFLRRHDRSSAEYQKEFIELNKGKLGKDNSLILGTKYTLPSLKESVPVAKKNHEPLFGKKLADYDIISNELAGAHFYVVSGHGGPDPGAIGKMDNAELHEDEYAYDITLRLARNLLMRGATVHIIIQDKNDGIRDERILKNSKTETCMGSTIPLNQVQRLKQRSEKINELQRKNNPKYSRAIFIHIDSRSKSQQTDVYFYHAGSSTGKKLAETMRNTFAGKYRQHQPNRGFRGTVDQRGLYVLRNSSPVGLYVELGNIQNSFDQRRFVIDDNRQALANWLCEGFITDYKSYK